MARSQGPRKDTNAGSDGTSTDGAQPNPKTEPEHAGTDDASTESERSITVVGCGASAGGLEAFSQLLAAFPADLDAAIVLVQHLAPEHQSMLATLLQHHTPLRVDEAQDG